MIKAMIAEKEDIFRVDPHDQRLKTHKLNGRLEGCHSFSVNNKYRIIFTFVSSDHAFFTTVGTHDIYE